MESAINLRQLTNQTMKQCVQCFAGSPLYLQVVNPANKMSLHYGNATTSVPVTQTVWATVNLAGYACHISPEAIIPTVVGVYFSANISLKVFLPFKQICSSSFVRHVSYVQH